MGSRKLRQLCYNSQSLVEDLNPRPHKYAAGVLTTQLWHLLTHTDIHQILFYFKTLLLGLNKLVRTITLGTSTNASMIEAFILKWRWRKYMPYVRFELIIKQADETKTTLQHSDHIFCAVTCFCMTYIARLITESVFCLHSLH